MSKKRIASLLLIAALAFGISVPGMAAATASPLIQIDMNENTQIYGLTALTSLGKKTGTLEEFAASLPIPAEADYLCFPANFFQAYDDLAIIG
ncbi:MAG: hypothetical protein LBS62_14305, partial [Clostridiales bacterium]|nr:hypothetical protein [Clostridiales bacterium]